MPDILGGSYYGNESYTETAPGGAMDQYIGYDPYAPDDGYLNTEARVFDAFGETIEWGGGSDPYQSPMLSTSDLIRSRSAGVPYPAAPINVVPPTVGQTGERSGLDSLFKGVVDVFGKTAVTLAGTLAANALERAVPGRAPSSATKAGMPVGLPPRPYVLPSILGGGTFSPSGSNMTFLAVIAVIGGLILFRLIARR